MGWFMAWFIVCLKLWLSKLLHSVIFNSSLGANHALWLTLWDMQGAEDGLVSPKHDRRRYECWEMPCRSTHNAPTKLRRIWVEQFLPPGGVPTSAGVSTNETRTARRYRILPTYIFRTRSIIISKGDGLIFWASASPVMASRVVRTLRFQNLTESGSLR